MDWIFWAVWVWIIPISLSLTPTEIVDNLLLSYNSKQRPNEEYGNTTDIGVNIVVNKIGGLDEVKMEFIVDIYMRQIWTDHRLASSDITQTVTLNERVYDSLWVPDLYFSNAKSAKFHSVPEDNRLIRLSAGGQILHSQRLQLILGCEMDLIRFPMDNQSCKITIESFAFSTDDVNTTWSNSDPIVLINDISLPDYTIEGVTSGSCTYTYPLTGTFSCIYGEIKFKRVLGYYLTQLYIPSVLIVMLSWVNFWIDSGAVPARVSLALLTIVTIVTQNSGISNRLPRVSYTKAIDVWMATCLVFVFCGLLEYCLVNVFNRKDKEDGMYVELQDDNEFDEIDDLEMQDDAHNHGEGVNNKTMKGKKSIATWTKSVKLRAKKKKVPRKKLFMVWLKKKWGRWGRSNGMMIDVVSRAVFPLAFVFFNMFYWIYYMLILK